MCGGTAGVKGGPWRRLAAGEGGGGDCSMGGASQGPVGGGWGGGSV